MNINDENSQDKFFKSYAEANLMDDKDVAAIKIKLGKSHRKESDWTFIKELLINHSLITIEPSENTLRLEIIDHILCDKGYFIAFTNYDDAKKYMRAVNIQDNRPERNFLVGAISFENVINASHYYRRDVLIDVNFESSSRCLHYSWQNQSIEATFLA